MVSVQRVCLRPIFRWLSASLVRELRLVIFHLSGQRPVIIVAFRNRVSRLPSWSWQIAPYAIGSFACFWLIARLAAF